MVFPLGADAMCSLILRKIETERMPYVLQIGLNAVVKFSSVFGHFTKFNSSNAIQCNAEENHHFCSLSLQNKSISND